MRRLLGLLFLFAAPLSAQLPLNIVWTREAVAQTRFLYAHFRTEFAGCLYGHVSPDTVSVNFFISSATDPRTASDSGVAQGSCANITTAAGSYFVGVMHSHIRPNSLCLPSHKDLLTLEIWRVHGAIFGAIMCARGDSIAVFSARTHTVFAVPPLDSLYPKR